VFVISAYCDSASFFEWISESDGPDGVLDKTASLYEIRAALTQVLTKGSKYIPPSIWKREQGGESNPLHKLQLHELRVLRDVAMGYKLPDIARRQNLAFNTVRSYMNDIYCKLELPSNTLQAAAVAYARAVYEGGLESLVERSDP
jgi:DNA-binding NarL/FixJ family response regulator